MDMFSDVLLTVDFDRTLTGPDGRVPERNLEAIRYFMDHGGKFTVNTGRSVPSFHQYLDVIPVNAPFLLYNGSAAYYQGQLMNQKIIQEPMWEVLHRMQQEFPELNLEVQGIDNHYLIGARPEVAELYDVMGWPHVAAEDGQDLGPFLKFSIVGTPDKMQISTWFDKWPEQAALFDAADRRIQELYGDTMVTFRAAERIIDVHARGVSKINAARKLQEQLGRKILVCVGDGENDVSMLEGADYAFSPCDAVVADRFSNVCACAEGAVADVIYKKIPEILGCCIDICKNVC